MMTHGELYDLIDSNVGPSEGAEFKKAYIRSAKIKPSSSPQMKNRMSKKHLGTAIEIAHAKRAKGDPRYQAVVDVLTKERDKLRAPKYISVQQALQQAQEELKKAQAENEQLRKDLTKAQEKNERLETLIHLQQTEPISKQLEKLTEKVKQLENTQSSQSRNIYTQNYFESYDNNKVDNQIK